MNRLTDIQEILNYFELVQKIVHFTDKFGHNYSLIDPYFWFLWGSASETSVLVVGQLNKNDCALSISCKETSLKMVLFILQLYLRVCCNYKAHIFRMW